MQETTLLFIGPLFPVVFIMMWCSVLFAIAKFSGWSRLSEKYICRDSPPLSWKPFCSGSFGFSNYNSSLWVAFSAEGLYLKTGPLFFFRPFHPVICIPWSAIESVQEKQIFFRRGFEITVINPRITFRLYLREFDEAERFLGKSIKRIQSK